jgi:hypothetical protein
LKSKRIQSGAHLHIAAINAWRDAVVWIRVRNAVSNSFGQFERSADEVGGYLYAPQISLAATIAAHSIAVTTSTLSAKPI